jgi:DNA-binding transcriptional ArsR family regulator
VRLKISQPGVSKHLRVLRDAGLVEVRPEGRRRWYGLRAQPSPKLVRGLSRTASSGRAASMRSNNI